METLTIFYKNFVKKGYFCFRASIWKNNAFYQEQDSENTLVFAQMKKNKLFFLFLHFYTSPRKFFQNSSFSAFFIFQKDIERSSKVHGPKQIGQVYVLVGVSNLNFTQKITIC